MGEKLAFITTNLALRSVSMIIRPSLPLVNSVSLLALWIVNHLQKVLRNLSPSLASWSEDFRYQSSSCVSVEMHLPLIILSGWPYLYPVGTNFYCFLFTVDIFKWSQACTETQLWPMPFLWAGTVWYWSILQSWYFLLISCWKLDTTPCDPLPKGLFGSKRCSER